MLELRKILVYKEDAWAETEMKDLKIGDMFKMFEPDGEKEPVVSLNGTTEWVVKTEPVELEGGNWQVDVEK